MTLTQIATALTAVGVIGGGALTLDRMHVATGTYSAHVEAEESRYVLQLKKELREIYLDMQRNPDDTYLPEYYADLIDELCELRPDDKLCN